MELYINQANYTGFVSGSAGILVVIHNKTEVPFPGDNGFYAAPGAETYVGITRVSSTNLN